MRRPGPGFDGPPRRPKSKTNAGTEKIRPPVVWGGDRRGRRGEEELLQGQVLIPDPFPTATGPDNGPRGGDIEEKTAED